MKLTYAAIFFQLIILSNFAQAECIETNRCIVKASNCHNDGLNTPSSYTNRGWSYTGLSKSVFTFKVTKKCWGERQAPFDVDSMIQEPIITESQIYSYNSDSGPNNNDLDIIQRVSEADRKVALEEADAICKIMRQNQINDLLSCDK
jgi:hypothetical protein